MKYLIAVMVALMAAGVSGQTKSRPRKQINAKPAVEVKSSAVADIDPGTISGKVYRNPKFRFEIGFPDAWEIAESGFEQYTKEQGVDLDLKAPDELGVVDRRKIDKSLANVKVFVTAFRSSPDSNKNVVVRIAAENLKGQPQIKDAVDYFDAVRNAYAAMKLPADFKYSETQAERLGFMQFGFIDTSNKIGKKRVYATVRDGFAILISVAYSDENDLHALRQILAMANFHLK